jgi:hypothetical protein
MIEYEYEDLVLEFTPESGYTKGYLAVSSKVNDTVFGERVDIAAPRARANFVKHARELYPEVFENELALRRALNELSIHATDAERAAASKAEEEGDGADNVTELDPPEPGSERHKAAMRILLAVDVLELAAKAMYRLGHVGEWANKKLAFACAVSARAQLPVQPSTHAQSAAGKNYLWDTALDLVPAELVYKRTGFSAKALFRTSMSLKHSVLYIQELAGSEGADFSIRTLQSDNVLKWEATEKQPDGTMANVEYEVEGPTVIVQTTTKNHLHPENETRVVPLYLDESSEQTERITKEVLKRAAGKGSISEVEREELRAVWHDVVRLLEPAEVIVPFAERIQVPSAPLRLRRDVPRLLNIIRLVAWVHQHTRKRDSENRIIATEDDFKKAVDMVGDSFARAWKSLTPSEEKVYKACTSLPVNVRKHGFKRSNVEKALEEMNETLPTRTVQDCLYTLTLAGYLESDGKRGAAGATYTVTGTQQVSGTITLAAHSRIDEKEGENSLDKGNAMRKGDLALSRALQIAIDAEEGSEADNAMRENARNASRALKAPQTTGKVSNAQTRKESATKEKELELEFEYSEDD